MQAVYAGLNEITAPELLGYTQVGASEHSLLTRSLRM